MTRGTGVINNRLCVGELMWNRLRYINDPSTGKRVSRLNPSSAWTVTQVLALRIVSDELWQAVKASTGCDAEGAERRSGTRPRTPADVPVHPPDECGVCGSGFTMFSKDRLACAGSHNRGTCDNRLTIRRDEVESRVLKAMEERL